MGTILVTFDFHQTLLLRKSANPQNFIQQMKVGEEQPKDENRLDHSQPDQQHRSHHPTKTHKQKTIDRIPTPNNQWKLVPNTTYQLNWHGS